MNAADPPKPPPSQPSAGESEKSDASVRLPTPTESAALGALPPLAQIMEMAPQPRALGIRFLKADHGRAWCSVPYRADLVGDPDTGIIAGGVITTLLDHTCAAAVHSAQTEFSAIATVDLRIDYMRGAKPGREVIVEAHCYKLGRQIAFVRAVAYEDSPDAPIAHAAGAFMVNASAGRAPGHNLPSAKAETP